MSRSIRPHPRFPLGIRQLVAFLLFVLAMLFSARADELVYDAILRGGHVIDGTGKPPGIADIGIRDGKITVVGSVAGIAKLELSVAGFTVAPGFIDVHTHAEEIDELPLAENFLRMGVTTIVLGNCGSSVPNVAEFFQSLESITMSPNVATLIGHGTVRRIAMRGSFNRPPSPEELASMEDHVRRAMQEGALGLSTGLIYLPGTFARTDEIVALARIAAEFDGLYATHQRSESGEIIASLEEIFRIAREAKIRAQISHLKLSGPANWGQADRILRMIDDARATGLVIAQDQYAYTASSTGLSQLIPDAMLEGGREKFRERLNDPALREGMVAEMKAMLRKRKSPDYSFAVIASFPGNPCYNGMNVVQAAKLERGNISIDDQIETIIEVEAAGGATAVFHGMSDDDVRVFMRHPNTMFASDSGVRRFRSDVPHPRGYGNNARILARYVREKNVLSLEEAIRRMTSLPAATFRLADRGEIRPGAWADLVVFNPAEIRDPSTYTDPHHYATGFRYVFVNGAIVVDNDHHTGARPGKVLRSAASSSR